MFIALLFILNSDSLTGDSLKSDSIEVYRLSDLVSFGESSPSDSFFYILKSNHPENYDLSLSDALFCLPLFTLNNVHRLLIFAPFHTDLRLNGHSLGNCFFGGVNPVLLPIQFLKTVNIKTRNDGKGEYSVELTSKVYEYERPFSSIFFTLLGEDKMYNIDFSRALSRNSFIYLSGVYSNFLNRFDALFLKSNSLYTNFYYNQFIPARFDFFYTTANYDGFLKSTFFDGSLTLGNHKNKMALLYTLYTDDFATDNYDTVIKNTVRKISLCEESYMKQGDFELNWGINGTEEFLNSDFYNSQDCRYLSLWQDLMKSFSRFLFGISGQWEVDKDKQLNFSPRGFAGSRIYDSTFIIMSVGLSHYKPLISQRLGMPASFYSNYFLNPAPLLKSEKFLVREVQLKSRHFLLNFYKADITNYIYYQYDSIDYYTPRNLDFLPTEGLSGYFQSPVFFNSLVEFTGNYFFQYSPLLCLPQSYASLTYLWQRKKSRSVIGLGVRFKYAGELTGPFGDRYEPFYIISPFISIRFITLSLSANLNNSLNQSIPNQNLKGTEFNIIIKWDFWD
ncbi:MAG: hypothetical protein ABIL70_02055 [candidate division WOR-3 bacterium]